MIDYERIARLRALISELQRTAPSDDRDALLRNAHNRLAALELGQPEPSGWPVKAPSGAFPHARPRSRPWQL